MTETTLETLSAAGTLAFSDGYRTRKDQLAETGIPILRVADMGDGLVTPATGDRIADSYRVKMGLKTSRTNDVLVSTKGTVGRVAYVPEDFPEHVYSPQLCFLRVRDRNLLDSRWLYYWARSPGFLSQVAMYSGQTDMAPYLSLRDLACISIDVPPLAEQRRIAGVLGALDDLIEVNRGLISHLVQLSEAVILGSLGEQSGPLSQVATVHRGTGYKSSDFADDGGKLCVGMGACSQTGLLKQEKIRRIGREISEKYVAQPFDIIMSNVDLTWDFGILAWPIVVPNEFEDGLVFTSDIYALRMKEESNLPSVALWAQLRSDRFRQFVEGCARGTTVASISRDDILSFPIRDQESPEATLFAGAALRLAWALTRENGQIAETRDELLPLLMSGRVRVRVDDVVA